VVCFTGWQADVRPWLAALDIFALPSYGEPFSIALLEAMAAGLPAIACLGSGATDIMITGRNGMLVSPGSVDELKQALGALLADPEGRRRIGQDGPPAGPRAAHAWAAGGQGFRYISLPCHPPPPGRCGPHRDRNSSN
jgi:glycosyltransferase involved in cell wall biosynthesis